MGVVIFPDRKKEARLKIEEVATAQQFDDFINFPYQLFRRNPYYVPPLKSDQKITLQSETNPAFEHCISKYWLAYKGDRIVGRIAGIINYGFIKKWNKNYARFGWFDFEDDEQITQKLLRTVEQWAASKGMDAVHGPMGFTNFDPAGMLIKGFDLIATLATLYNYPYYRINVEKAGYEKEIDWVEYKFKLERKVPDKVKQLADIVRRRNKVKLFNPGGQQDIEKYAREIFLLINTCYSHLHGMVELTERQIQYYTKRYLPILRKDFISLVLNENEELIAFGVIMPSLSRALQKANGSLFPFGFLHVFMDMRINSAAELCLVAVRPDYQGKGINALLIEEANKTFIRNNIFIVESNPELEDNERVQSQWTYYDSEQHKRRRCYIKFL